VLLQLDQVTRFKVSKRGLVVGTLKKRFANQLEEIVSHRVWSPLKLNVQESYGNFGITVFNTRKALREAETT
jgi:hypothetical protein